MTPSETRSIIAGGTHTATAIAGGSRLVDISIENHGSVWLVRPHTEFAAQWLYSNVQRDALWFAGALVVEPRFVATLVAGIQDDGLLVD